MPPRRHLSLGRGYGLKEVVAAARYDLPTTSGIAAQTLLLTATLAHCPIGELHFPIHYVPTVGVTSANAYQRSEA